MSSKAGQGDVADGPTATEMLLDSETNPAAGAPAPPAQTALPGLTACPACDLLLDACTVRPGYRLRCPRCNTVVQRAVGDSVSKTLAISLTGLLLYLPAMFMPIMTFSIAGIKESGSVVDAFRKLMEAGYFGVGLMVMATSLLFPLIKLTMLFIVSFGLTFRCFTNRLAGCFRVYGRLAEWAMVEVYMLAILVTVIKMLKMADIQYNTGFFCFSLIVLITVGASVVVDAHRIWQRIGSVSGRERPRPPMTPETERLPCTAREAGITRCHDCGLLVGPPAASVPDTDRCPRCNAALHMRKPDSLNRTWALVICAAIFLLPANILPIMRMDFLGAPTDSTILDGIIYFFRAGEYGIGAIIFIASVLVPLFKVVGIVIILLSIRFRRERWLENKTAMFHFIEFIGRWSFLDIFVIALLGTLVRFGALTTIEAAPAVPYFTAAVFTTMLAATTFDTRILWDVCTAPECNAKFISTPEDA